MLVDSEENIPSENNNDSSNQSELKEITKVL